MAPIGKGSSLSPQGAATPSGKGSSLSPQRAAAPLASGKSLLVGSSMPTQCISWLLLYHLVASQTAVLLIVALVAIGG